MLSSHDHGNCELCDHIERRLAQVQKELSNERMWREHYQTMANVTSKNNTKLRDQLTQARLPAQPPGAGGGVMFILLARNTTGGTVSSYDVEVRINHTVIWQGEVHGHVRTDGWEALVRRIAAAAEARVEELP